MKRTAGAVLFSGSVLIYRLGVRNLPLLAAASRNLNYPAHLRVRSLCTFFAAHEEADASEATSKER